MWTYIGLNSFGGPTGQIAVTHKVLVEDKCWISEERFLHALNYCMLLPGPEAMQLATYVGWLMHRTLGGIVAGVLFVLPGFLAILALSVAYTTFRGVGVVESMFFGLQAAVLAIVVEAVLRIGKKVLKNEMMYGIAAASFVAIFCFSAPFPLIVVTAALLGFFGDRICPDLFEVLRFKSVGQAGADRPVYATDLGDPAHTKPTTLRSARTLLVWGTLWLVPVAALHLWLGPDNVFSAQSWFFSKAAVVTFGGAYAVLAYMAQQAVEVYGWLKPSEMLTGLGMAETTPGPLIQVVQFVGFMGAYRDPGILPPWLAGGLASVLTTWVTFMPCFLWIFLGAPYMELLRGRTSLNAALSSITAAVVGVVLNLAVWFALHTLFRQLTPVEAIKPLGIMLQVPVLSSVDWRTLFIAAVAAWLIFRMHWDVLRVLGVAAGMSVAWYAVQSVAA